MVVAAVVTFLYPNNGTSGVRQHARGEFTSHHFYYLPYIQKSHLAKAETRPPVPTKTKKPKKKRVKAKEEGMEET